METPIKIRAAKIDDAQDLLDIYGYYVKNTAITYEYEVPTLEEFQSRILNTLRCYPYLVAELDGQIVGYAYAGKFQSRPGYGWDAEMTVYLRHDIRGNKIGEKLYTLLEKILYAQGVVKVIALITSPKETEYNSTYNSMRFHEKMGYCLAGHIENCGYKFNQWYDTILMDKTIGIPQKNMCFIKSFNEVRKKFNI